MTAERFDAVELVRWQNDEAFRLLMVTLAAILPLRRSSQLEEERCRTSVLDLSDGNTGRIFRLVETLAIRAIENGSECIEASDLDADDLLMPSVSMKVIAQRRARTRARGRV